MGNVPISCCRSRSPRLQHASSTRSNSGNYRNNDENNQRSTSNRDLLHGGKYSDKHHNLDDDGGRDVSRGGGGGSRGGGNHRLSHNLQHISEREPNDSETDPSSNPLDRPIFATRSSSSKNKNYNDSYSSYNSSSNRSKQTNTPLMISQDHGYNSTTSTNITHYDGQLNDSFDNSIQQHQHLVKSSTVHDQLLSPDVDNQNLSNKTTSNLNDNRLLFMNSTTTNHSVDIDDQSWLSSSRFDSSHESKQSSKSHNNNLVKSSSCSTIFVDSSTISQPNLDQTIKCVSLAIYFHIRNRTSDCSADIFDESIHPLKIPNISAGYNDELITLDQNNRSTRLNEPDQKTIYNFVNTLFKAAELTSEYAITTLVYLERLMTYAEMDLTPKTWRRMFLGAILLSSKVWEDQAVWNVDYAQILEEISVEDINELERQFLELIEFNMNVPSSVYAKYYFHLRTLALKYGLNTEHTLLTVGKATALEVSGYYLNSTSQI